MDNTGRKRVFITNILPSVDDGLYPAKTIINEPTLLSADIFADGHDELKACIQIKHADQKTWQDYPLIFF
jgi:starch synthase (maltosyl-transferring)